MAHYERVAGPSLAIRDVSGAIVAHHPTAQDHLRIELGNDPAGKDDCRWLLLIHGTST
jgi:hypothetical protein